MPDRPKREISDRIAWPTRTTAQRAALIAAAALIFEVVFAFSGWLATGHHPEELDGWIGAVATFAAVVAGALAGLFAYQAYRLELARDGRWTEDAKRAQASKVSVWADMLRQQYFVRNASDAPVYDVIVQFTSGFSSVRFEPTGMFDEVAVLPPSSEPEKHLVPPSVYEAAHSIAKLTTAVSESELALDLEVSMTFRDASGRSWHRDANGYLTLIGDI